MRRRSAFTSVFCLLAAIVLYTEGLWLWADVTLRPVAPLKLSGAVSIAVRPYNTFLILSLHVRRGGDLVPGLRVTIMGQPATEPSPGFYRCEISGFSPTPGSLVTVSIAGAPRILPIPPAGREEPLVATATIGSLVAFTNPAPEAHISRASLRPLTISWRGGNPPYSLTIYPFTGKDEVGEAVFEQSGIAGTSVAVPMAYFRTSGKYGIYLSCMMEKFRFSRKIDPGSNFQLRQSRGTYIYIE